MKGEEDRAKREEEGRARASKTEEKPLPKDAVLDFRRRAMNCGRIPSLTAGRQGLAWSLIVSGTRGQLYL